MAKKPQYGLLIDYEYCTGCYACRVACSRNTAMRRDRPACRSSSRYNRCPKARPTCAFCRFQPNCAYSVRRVLKKASSRPVFSTAWLTLSNGDPWKSCPSSWGKNRAWCSGRRDRLLSGFILTTCCQKMNN